MRDFLQRFSLLDFLAYFFPGVAGLAGLYVLLLWTPLRHEILNVQIDLARGLALLILTYVIGVVFSGFSWPLLRLIHAVRALLHRILPGIKAWRDPREEIHPREFASEIVDALRSTVDLDGLSESRWALSHFYLARCLIDQFMPTQSFLAQRQSALRLFRQYMFLPVLIWTSVGVVWGVDIAKASPKGGMLVATTSIFAGVLVIAILNARLSGNRLREVRQVYLALLVGYRTGIIPCREAAQSDDV